MVPADEPLEYPLYREAVSKTKIATGIAGIAFVSSALYSFIAGWEGKVNTARIDPISGVVDVCHGHTGRFAILGKTYTDKQCHDILIEDISTHKAGVLKCIQSPANENEINAFTSLAFTVGVKKVCDSTPMRLFNAGFHDQACESFILYNGSSRRDKFGNTIPGTFRVIKGLQNRREAERIWCMTPSQGPRGAALLELMMKPVEP